MVSARAVAGWDILADEIRIDVLLNSSSSLDQTLWIITNCLTVLSRGVYLCVTSNPCLKRGRDRIERHSRLHKVSALVSKDREIAMVNYLTLHSVVKPNDNY
jgi:hypothetical protein